jgi:hypothetical protein
VDPRYAARLVVRISVSDVGRRVSVRRRLSTGAYSDVVGILESWSEGVLRVRRRDGSVVAVPAESMVAGKVVPQHPPRPRRPRTPPRE